MGNASKNRRGIRQHMLLVFAAVCIFLFCGTLAGAKVLQNSPAFPSGAVSETVTLVFENETLLQSPTSTSAFVTQSAEESKGKININIATAEEMTALKGIGAVKAEAIVTYRRENGSFQSIYELMQVSGIGEKTFAEIKENITV